MERYAFTLVQSLTASTTVLQILLPPPKIRNQHQLSIESSSATVAAAQDQGMIWMHVI